MRFLLGKKSSEDTKYANTKERINQIGLTLLSSQLMNSSNYNSKSNNDQPNHRLPNASNTDEISMNIVSLKHYLGNATTHHKIQKPISINNLVFKDGGKYSRVLSAKPQKTTAHINSTNGSHLSDKPSANFDLQIQPPSPVQFQSLQADSLLGEPAQHQKRLSPVSVNNLSINGNAPPQYFSQKRSSNILGLQQVAAQKANLKQR